MKKSTKIVLLSGCGMLGLLLYLGLPVLLVVVPMKFTGAANLTPEQEQEFKVWNTAALKLPPEALEAKPFRKETVAAAAEFQKKYSAMEKQVTSLIPDERPKPGKKTPDMYADADYPLPGRQLDELKPLAEAFTRLVAQPDYCLDAITAGLDLLDEKHWPPTPNFRMVQNPVKMLAMQALRLSREGKHTEALELAETIVKASRVDVHTNVITTLIAVAVHDLGVRAWAAAVDRCDDPALLEHTLRAQQPLAAVAPRFPEELTIDSFDDVGELRWFVRQGRPVAMQGLTGSQLKSLKSITTAKYMEEIILPALEKDPERQGRSSEVQEQMQSQYGMAKVLGPFDPSPYRYRPIARYQKRLVHEGIQKIMFNIARPDFEEARTRARIAASRFNLLQLKTARKLYRLREGREATEAAALVPKYLPELPKDPFENTERADRFYRFEKVDYSIGPDGVDQKTELVYDPSNGTISPGDVVLK